MTHQCFLSTRSLYLVVWNVTEGEEAVAELGPWLHNIQVWRYTYLSLPPSLPPSMMFAVVSLERASQGE